MTFVPVNSVRHTPVAPRTALLCVMQKSAFTLLVALFAAGPMAAQTAPPATRWAGAVEASGNLLYGAASQRILASAVVAERIDEKAERVKQATSSATI